MTSGTEQDKIGRVIARGVKQGRIKYSFGSAAAGFSIARNSGYVSYDGTPIDAARARLRIVAEDRDEVATDVSHVQYVDVTQPASLEQEPEPDPVPPDPNPPEPELSRQVTCNPPRNLSVQDPGSGYDYFVLTWRPPSSSWENVRKYYVKIRPNSESTLHSAFVQDEVGNGQYSGRDHIYATDWLYKSKVSKEIVHHVESRTSNSSGVRVTYSSHTHPITSGTSYTWAVNSVCGSGSSKVTSADATSSFTKQ